MYTNRASLAPTFSTITLLGVVPFCKLYCYHRKLRLWNSDSEVGARMGQVQFVRQNLFCWGYPFCRQTAIICTVRVPRPYQQSCINHVVYFAQFAPDPLSGSSRQRCRQTGSWSIKFWRRYCFEPSQYLLWILWTRIYLLFICLFRRPPVQTELRFRRQNLVFSCLCAER